MRHWLSREDCSAWLWICLWSSSAGQRHRWPYSWWLARTASHARSSSFLMRAALWDDTLATSGLTTLRFSMKTVRSNERHFFQTQSSKCSGPSSLPHMPTSSEITSTKYRATTSMTWKRNCLCRTWYKWKVKLAVRFSPIIWRLGDRYYFELKFDSLIRSRPCPTLLRLTTNSNQPKFSIHY